ncbi:MAG TPA: cytochrome c3 family protein [Acidobacteriota bacterium]|nr:cytochrome c3 family protein [Acidobacteriota bacterium]
MAVENKACACIILCSFIALMAWPWSGGKANERAAGFVVYPGAGSPGPVVFSHVSHGDEGAGYSCDRCHGAAATAADVAGEDTFHGGNCGECHDGRSMSPRLKSAPAIANCKRCHMPKEDTVITMSRMDPVPFSHARHLGVNPSEKTIRPSGFTCNDCHPGLFGQETRERIRMESPHNTGDSCSSCHDGKQRESGIPPAFAATTRCLTCHVLSENYP